MPRTYRSLPALARRREALYQERRALAAQAQALEREERELDRQALTLLQSADVPSVACPGGGKIVLTTKATCDIRDWSAVLTAVGGHCEDEAWCAVVHRRVSPGAVEALVQAGTPVPGVVLNHQRVARFMPSRKKKEK